MSAQYSDPYRVLGLTSKHSFKAIRQRFKDLVLKLHPDRPNGNSERFDMVKRAYKIIYDHYMSQKQLQTRTSMDYDSYTSLRNQNVNLPKPNKTTRDFNELFLAQRKPQEDGRKAFLDTDTQKMNPLPIAIISDPQGWINVCTETSLCKADGTRCRADDYSTYCKPGTTQKKIQVFDIKHAYAVQESIENMGNSRGESQLNDATSQQYQSQRDIERYERQFTPYRIR